MKKQLHLTSRLFFLAFLAGLPAKVVRAQQCLTTGYCSAVSHAYPTGTFSTTSSSWQTISPSMNAGNFTYFKVVSGNKYEWSYCEAYGGVSTGWDAQLTLMDSANGTNLCFSDNVCGTSGNAPYLSWTATFTGTVKVLTSVASCTTNTGTPYNKLVWRMANGVVSTQVLGLDVSHYDGAMNWTCTKADKKSFAWAKATEGINYTDPTYVTNQTNGTSAGVYMAGYHFAHPETNSGAAEAAYFLSVAGPYIKACNLMPALDFETTGSLTGAQLTTYVQDWMTYVINHTGITPVIYTSSSIASMLSSSVKNYPLWMADPDSSSTLPPANLGGWITWAFKQYHWQGTVCGTVPVDLDVYNGNLNQLEALIGCVTGIQENSAGKMDVLLYPNPASDRITIENTSFNNNGKESIAVYNMQGQLVLYQQVTEPKTEIEISGYKTGLYIVKVESGSRVEVKKFIKE
jgi:GH25 family lysozyme M1 (1,4-beta-N-acetylmuramidase)